jgi:hypothetical protein
MDNEGRLQQGVLLLLPVLEEELKAEFGNRVSFSQEALGPQRYGIQQSVEEVVTATGTLDMPLLKEYLINPLREHFDNNAGGWNVQARVEGVFVYLRLRSLIKAREV